MIRERLLTGALSNVAAKAISVAIWFLLTPFVLAQLGPSGYALWVLTGAVASYGLLLDCGVGGAVVKYVAEHVARGERDAARVIVASALWVSLGLAMITIAAAMLVAPFIAGLLDITADQRSLAIRLIVLTGIDLAITIAFSPRIALLKGLQRYDLYNGVNLFGTVLQAAATVSVLLAHGGVLGVVAANIPVTIAMRVASTVIVRRVAPDLTPSFHGAERSVVRRLASYSVPSFGIDVASRLQGKTDEFVIAMFHMLTAVTPYALARKLGEATSIAAVQCVKAVMPIASELDATDRGPKLRALYIVASRIALGIAVPVAAVLLVAGGAVLTVWVGPEYAAHADVVAILALSSVIATSQGPAGDVLQGIARHRIVASTALASGVANVGLSILLLPRLGLRGVALGTLIPTAIASLCVLMPFANRTIGVSWKTAFKEIWVPGLLPGLAAMAVLSFLHSGADAPDIVTLASWIVITCFVYAGGYLSMPASAAERQLIADFVSGGSRSVIRLLTDPLKVR